jgi:GTPase SAR1 family protein
MQTKNERKVILLGLDSAGKSTVLYRLRFNQGTTIPPTTKFNFEEVKFLKLKLNIWVRSTDG